MNYTLISGKNCIYCKKAREALYNEGVDYIEIRYYEGHPYLKTLMRMAGLTTVPQVFGPTGEYIGGYEALLKHLGK